MNACQAAFLLIFVARSYSIETAGVVTIGYALGVLLMAAGKYGIRNFQVTDDSQFSTNTYVTQRILAVILATIIGLLYLVIRYATGAYTIDKLFIIFEIVILKMQDSLEDVFIGRFQQVGQFYHGALIFSIRQTITTALLCVLAIMAVNIHSVFIIAIVVSFVAEVILLWWKKEYMQLDAYRFSLDEKLWDLFRVCFPLALGTTLASYVSNVPKYAIDLYMDEKTQAIFGYLMLPVFVVALVNQFVYQPFVKELGEAYSEGNIKLLKRKVLIEVAIVIVVSLMILVGCMLVGLPLLSVLYSVDLTAYKLEFAVLLLGGTLYALAFYLSVPLTTMRKQHLIAWGFLVASVIALISQSFMVNNWGMLGASWLYVLVNGLIVAVFGIRIVVEK